MSTSSTTFCRPSGGVKIINIPCSKSNFSEYNKKKEKIYLQYMRTMYYINHLRSNTPDGSSRLYSDINLDICSLPLTTKCTSSDFKQKKEYKNLSENSSNSKNVVYDPDTLCGNNQKGLKRTETFNLILAPCRNKSVRVVLDKFGKLNKYNQEHPRKRRGNPVYDRKKDVSHVHTLPKKFELPEQLKDSVFRKRNKVDIETTKRSINKNLPILPPLHQDIPKELFKRSRKLNKPPKYKSEETQTSPRGEDGDIIVNVVATKSEDDICLGLKMKDRKDEEVYIRCQPNEDVNVKHCIKYYKNENKKGYDREYFKDDNVAIKEIFNSHILKKYTKF